MFDSMTAAQLLDAIDGVAYVLAVDATILAVGRPSWMDFAAANGADGLTPEQVVGRPLFAMISGAEVEAAQRQLHRWVVSDASYEINYDYRCDGPEKERVMRMSIRPIQDRGSVVAVLYQSQILREVLRVPMPLFSTDLNIAFAPTMAPDRIVTLCSYCHDVVWPVGAPRETRNWIKPEEYYRLGGSNDVAVSHGICPPCYARVVAPRLAGTD